MQETVLIDMLCSHNILSLTCKQQSKMRDGIFIIGYQSWKTVLHYIIVKMKSFENHYLTHLATLTHGLFCSVSCCTVNPQHLKTKPQDVQKF